MELCVYIFEDCQAGGTVYTLDNGASPKELLYCLLERKKALTFLCVEVPYLLSRVNARLSRVNARIRGLGGD